MVGDPGGCVALAYLFLGLVGRTEGVRLEQVIEEAVSASWLSAEVMDAREEMTFSHSVRISLDTVLVLLLIGFGSSREVLYSSGFLAKDGFKKTGFAATFAHCRRA